MAFTQDEIQSLHTIFEQKLVQQRQELEQSFELRMQLLRSECEQRLTIAQQEYTRTLTQTFTELQQKMIEAAKQRIDMLQTALTKVVDHSIGVQQQQMELGIERALAAQLLAIEQLINQRMSPVQSSAEQSTQGQFYGEELSPDFGAIEIQTEIPWQDFFDVVGKALDERLGVLSASIEASLKSLEQYLSIHLHSLHDELVREQAPNYNGSITSMHDVFSSIEHLEQIIESLQVAMTANHALLSNRLYHHQQLPLERAHKSTASQTPSETQLSLPTER